MEMNHLLLGLKPAAASSCCPGSGEQSINFDWYKSSSCTTCSLVLQINGPLQIKLNCYLAQLLCSTVKLREI